MKITIQSILFSCIIATFLIVLFAILIKNKKLYRFYHIDLLNTLFYVIVLRLVFPIETNLISIPIQEDLKNKISIHIPDTNNYLMINLYVLGILLFTINFIIKIYKSNKAYCTILNNQHSKTSYKNKYSIIFSPIIATPMVIGWHKEIFIPALDYSENELHYIMLHESKHIDFKDFWIKFLLSCLSILYWWFIPIHLFKHLVNIFLELRIDYNMSKNLNENTRFDYLETLISVSKKNNNIKYETHELSCTLTSNIEYRINYYLYSSKHKTNTFLLIFIILFSFLNSIITYNIYSPSTIIETTQIHHNFSNLDKNDKILQLPGGGWLYGEAEISSGGIFRKIKLYNSEKDTRAITVYEYLQKNK